MLIESFTHYQRTNFQLFSITLEIVYCGATKIKLTSHFIKYL